MTDSSADRTPDGPLDFSDVLLEECGRLHLHLTRDRVRFRHRVNEIKTDLLADRLSVRDQATESLDQETKDHLACQAVYQTMHEQSIKPSALCFSGGGIRSATFNLGVIQALAKLNLLDKFDYLSTVSGGGYIGAWLTAWVHRLKEAGGRDAPPHEKPIDIKRGPAEREGITAAQQELQANGIGNHGSLRSVQPPPLTWLREFSNYLTPTIGFFSADSWTMVGTSLRNLLLNWLVFIPLLIGAFMVPRLHVAWIRTGSSESLAFGLCYLGLAAALPTLVYLHLFRPSLTKLREGPQTNIVTTQDPGTTPSFQSQGWFLTLALAPLLLSAYCLTSAWTWYPWTEASLYGNGWFGLPAKWTFITVGMGLHLLGWGIAMWCLQRMRRVFIELVLIAASGAIGGFALWATLTKLSPVYAGAVKDYAEWYAAFGVPGFLGLFLLVATLFIGLAGRFIGDQDHEFWGRAGSWILNAGISLGTIGTLIIFGPGLLNTIGTWASAAIGGIAGLLSLVGGFSAKTLLQENNATDRLSRIVGYTIKLTTPLFIVVLIIELSLGTSYLATWYSSLWDSPLGEDWQVRAGRIPNTPDIHVLALYLIPWSTLGTLWLTLLAVGFLMGWCINVNKFSLHGFYRNRLIRAYLGASNTRRTPNRFTGFDDGDNIEMRDVGYVRNRTPDNHTRFQLRTLQKPFHVINIALNLVRGKNLAWQQRKAQSFTVSPLHCGSWQQVGYRSTKDYGLNQHVGRAISLGTAVATSGAAASPNMGYHSSAAVTFLLALFNIRLGWWLGNPGEAGGPSKWGNLITCPPTYNRHCPGFSVGPLLAELFGYTTASSRYVYLSDGGHFENLALYEMVLRRCHHIVVIDAGCDPELSFQDLGNAIRKIRIDQGVDIEIDTTMLKRQSGSSVSRWHHAIGAIRYDKADDGAPIGTLIYIKPSLTGDEPSDVQDYLAHHPTFPHEPTSDQFFDESQFESYRRLGEHITWEVFRHGFK